MNAIQPTSVITIATESNSKLNNKVKMWLTVLSSKLKHQICDSQTKLAFKLVRRTFVIKQLSIAAEGPVIRIFYL